MENQAPGDSEVGGGEALHLHKCVWKQIEHAFRWDKHTSYEQPKVHGTVQMFDAKMEKLC